MFTENKTVTAFVTVVASRLTGSVRAEDLVRVCADAGHFDVQITAEAFESLLDQGVLETADENGRNYISLGETGKTILPELAGMLPPSLAQDAVTEAVREYAALADGVKYRARIEETDGGYLLAAGAYSGEKTMCEVRLTLPDEKTAKAAKAHFEMNPDKTLANVSAIVTGDMEFLL